MSPSAAESIEVEAFGQDLPKAVLDNIQLLPYLLKTYVSVCVCV